METKKEQAVAETWEKFWKKTECNKWDRLSGNIYKILRGETLRAKNKLILETGSGTGRISCRLKEDSADEVILSDISKLQLRLVKDSSKKRAKQDSSFYVPSSTFPLKTTLLTLAGMLESWNISQKKNSSEL